MPLRVYNTLTKSLEEFKPLREGEVRIYVCGPTVYDYTHIGHARTYIAFDAIIRYLKFKGYRVKYVLNITNVDDKIINRAKERGEHPLDLAARFEREFLEDFKALGLLKPDVMPRVTDHIREIIEVVKRLIERGYAYVVKTGVYFDVEKFPDYGKLSGIKREELVAGARIEVDPHKKNPLDFALWKVVPEGELGWDSPWGRGRPGWHIECTVMSSKYLGPQFDIHGGGQDLIFPHHENEIAQSEAAFGVKPFVKYWLHTGYLTIRGEKMSKSLGNIIPLRDMLKRADPEAFRLFILSSHYRSPVDYAPEQIKAAKAKLRRLYNAIFNLKTVPKIEGGPTDDERAAMAELDELEAKFVEAMDDDFDTPRALAVLFEMAKVINQQVMGARRASREFERYAEGKLRKLGWVFGILQKPVEVEELPPEILEMIRERERARERKDWETADRIREELRKRGIIVEDTPWGPCWRRLEEAR